MSSRSRQRELAVLRCAGSTVRGVRRQVVIEAGLYVGTALLISIVPLSVTAVGEAVFYARAGLPLVVRPGVGRCCWWRSCPFWPWLWCCLLRSGAPPGPRSAPSWRPSEVVIGSYRWLPGVRGVWQKRQPSPCVDAC